MRAQVVLAAQRAVNYDSAMFKCDAQPGPSGLLTYVLRSEDGTAECHLVPERGAIVTRLRFGSDEVLFLDESTLVDGTKNVRGGIPVLFPQAGRLPNDAYSVQGHTFTLPQHGFARRMAWQVVEQGGTTDAAHLTCELQSTDETLSAFPWTFTFRLQFTLRSNELALEAAITNLTTEPMPHALGFHPYFRVPDAEKRLAGVRTDAKRAFDNTTGQTVLVRKLDFTVKELDLHLLDHSTQYTIMRRGSLPRLGLYWDPGFTTLVLWTLAGKDFICVEPWEAPAGALATKERLPWLPPGATVHRSFRIASGVR